MSRLVTQLKQQPLHFITPLRIAAVALVGYFFYFMLFIYRTEGRSFVVAGVIGLGILFCIGIDWLLRKVIKNVVYIWSIEIILLVLSCIFILPPGTINTRDMR